MSITSYTLTQIKGTRLEALFRWRWYKRLPSECNGRVFMDINIKCFGSVVDYLNEIKVDPPYCISKMIHLGEEDGTVI